ncbi:MAG: hypothetical protein ACR2M1_06945 [Gemmatimonadaceae bacterium]
MPTRLAALAGVVAMFVATLPSAALGQAAASRPAASAQSDTVRASCAVVARPTPPTDAQRRSARDLAARAQEASIVEDNATARNLYERAEKLDATDPTTAYALARAYETARDPRALGEYCRYLALSPNGSETADVRQRISSLSAEIAARNAAVQAAAVAAVAASTSPPRPPPVPIKAFGFGLLFPGAGQYYSRRPGAGFFFTAAAAGAVFYALQSKTVTTTMNNTAFDPNGKQYQYQTTSQHSDRPNAATGFGIAAATSLLGAVEASLQARAASFGPDQATAQNRSAPEPRVAATIAPLGRGVAFGVRLPVQLTR